MTYNLKKGDSYALAKTLNQCYIGLGWDINKSGSGYSYDLDVVALLLNESGKLIPPPHGVVFYNNPTFPSLPEHEWKRNGNRQENIIRLQAIWLSSDNRSGEGANDDEYIKIDFTKFPMPVSQIIIAACIYDAKARKQSFGNVRNSYIRIAQDAGQSDMARYDLETSFRSETCLVFGRLYNQRGWNFEAIGNGTHDDLDSLINSYV
jgi:tellurium resistance protein TerD